MLDELSTAMRLASICGLGQVVPVPIASVLKHFPECGGRAHCSPALSRQGLLQSASEDSMSPDGIAANRRAEQIQLTIDGPSSPFPRALRSLTPRA